MKIHKDAVVAFHYVLKDKAGKTLDSSAGQAPLEYMQGHGQIVPGLERRMEGASEGDAFEVVVLAADGYGERDHEAMLGMSRDDLPQGLDPQVGMQLAARHPEGGMVALRIVAVSETQVTLDANHPLAGEDLHFSVQIESVRAATTEELQHGHAHGAHGRHDHHEEHAHEHGPACQHDRNVN